jgi:hypothetical protein
MSQYDSIIRHLIDATHKSPWSERLSTCMKEHLDYAAHYLKTDIQVLETLLATKTQNYQQIAFGVVFEDFLGLVYEEKSLVDVYLAHSGWKESNRAKRYATLVAKRQPSIFVVSEVAPGKTLTLIDQLSGQIYRVNDKTVSHTLPLGTIFYARVLDMSDGFIFSGVMLPFDIKTAKIIFDVVNGKDTLEAVFDVKKEATNFPSLRLAGVAMTFWLANILGVAYQSGAKIPVTEAPVAEVPARLEETSKIEDESLDQVYRKMIRSRLPELGDKTPRMAMKTKAGKQQVVNWLLQLEQTKASYDFAWIWQELGLERPT